MKKKILSLLVLLMTAVSGAWAQQKYNVTFSGFDNASCNTTFTDVTLPYSKSFGKTDACSNAYDIDVSSNNEQFVGASFGSDNFTITVKSAFEGTITVSVGGMSEGFDPYSRNITVACVPAAPPFDYTFSVADCDHGTGTVKFFIDEKEVKGAYQADEGKTVTMTVTPDEGYVVGSVSANAYTTWAGARRTAPTIPMLGNVTLTPVESKANTWTFTMPAASVELKIGYLATSNIYLSKDALADKANIAVTAGETAVEFDEVGKSKTTVIEGSTVTTKYNGTKKVLGFKAVKKASTPTLKDALKDGATVVITYTWMGSNVTTFTYTKNGDEYTGGATGYDAGYFANGMSIDGTTLKFTASNMDWSDANVSIDFFTDSNEYSAVKGSSFTSFTISVNGTDLTSQLTAVK